MAVVLRCLISMVAIIIIAHLLPNVIWVETTTAALAAALILGIVNSIIRPILLVLTLPVTVMTFGIFPLFINGLLLWLVAALVPGFHVNGFFGAVIGSVLISIVCWILSILLPF